MFESRSKPVFSEEDVVNMFPVVKHLKHSATDATRLVQQAQVAVQQGEMQEQRLETCSVGQRACWSVTSFFCFVFFSPNSAVFYVVF